MLIRLFRKDRSLSTLDGKAIYAKFFRDSRGAADRQMSVYLVKQAADIPRTLLEHYAHLPQGHFPNAAVVLDLDGIPTTPTPTWTDNGGSFTHLYQCHHELRFATDSDVEAYADAVAAALQSGRAPLVYEKVDLCEELDALLNRMKVPDWEQFCQLRQDWKKNAKRRPVPGSIPPRGNP